MKPQFKKNEKELLKKEIFVLYYNNNKSIDEIASLYDKSIRTIFRWIKEEKNQNSSGLQKIKSKKKKPKKYPADIYNRIIELKEELPRRTSPNIYLILKKEYSDNCPSIPLIRKYIASKGLSKKDPNYKRGYVKFARDFPNDLWQIDIAGVQTIGTLGKLYLHAIIDDCSRFIITAKYYKDQRGINILQILRNALEEYGRPNQILADNGTQFKNIIGELGTRYSRLLNLLNIKPIFSSPRHPQTKGKLERWFGTVIKSFLNEKRYFIEQNPDISLVKFNELLKEWVHWYNFEKSHRSLPNYCPPSEIYFKHPKRLERPLNTIIDWNSWLYSKAKRRVSKYNTISYKTEIISLPEGYMGSKVEIWEVEDQIEIYHHEKCLKICRINQDIVELKNRQAERKITSNGLFSYKGQHFTLGSAYSGKIAKIKETNNGTKIAIYINDILIKEFEKNKYK